MKYLNPLKLLLAGAVFLMSSPAMAAISGSAHDFSGGTIGATYTAEICNVCHTPHNAKGAADGPLWAGTVTTETFGIYTDTIGTLDATDLSQPSGASLLCLSCHDGTIAVDSFAGGSTLITTSLRLGTDLSDDHPISFTYDTSLANTDGELFNPSVDTTAIGGTIAADMLIGGDQLECASCHDVHNTDVNGSYLLKIDNDNSALCLTCHDK